MGRVVIHRTGYGPFVSYLRRFGKEGTPVHGCGAPQEPQHLSYCPWLEEYRRKVMRESKKGRTSTTGLYRLMVGAEAHKFFPEGI